MQNLVVNMSPKDNNNPPITELKAMEFCDLADKKSELAVLMKLNKLQENGERRFEEIERAIHEQIEKLNKETEITK